MSHSTRSAWPRATALLLTGVAGFQAALASGLPWGRIAYGGRHQGRLPGGYRRASAGAAVTYAATAVFVASERGTPTTRRSVLGALTVLMTVGAGLNLTSRSPYERLIWTPVCVATAVSAWRAAGAPRCRVEL